MNTKKYRVVFDIDDTLNNLVETTYTKLNILHKLPIKKKYYLKDCPELTEQERAAAEATWSDGSTYLECSANKGIEKVDVLSNKKNVEVIIHSFCCNDSAALGKHTWLGSYTERDRLIMKLEVGNKTPIDDIDFVVEDKIEYLCKCKAKHKILIDKVYNKAENYDLDTSDIIRVDSLDTAIDYILNEIELNETAA